MKKNISLVVRPRISFFACLENYRFDETVLPANFFFVILITIWASL